MKAREVIDAIEKAAPRPMTPFAMNFTHFGDEEREVKKIVTTFMVTAEVARKAAEWGADMIVTHEPTFPFARPGDEAGAKWLAEDPVVNGKKKILADAGIVVWQFHDGMHAARPDMIYVGWNELMGWRSYNVPGPNNHIYHIPKTTLGELVALLKEKLDMPSIRIIGDPSIPVERVGVLVGGGSTGLGDPNMPAKTIQYENLDTLICGEIVEYGICEYVRDGVQLGLNRSAIMIGHERTEEWGMKVLPRWLKRILPEMEITFIEAGEPFNYL